MLRQNNSKPWFWAWPVVEVVSLPNFLASGASSPALPRQGAGLVHKQHSEERWGQLFHTHTSRDSSLMRGKMGFPVPMPQRSTLPNPHNPWYYQMVACGWQSQLKMVLGHQHGFRLYYRPQTASQTSAVVGPLISTQTLAASGPRTQIRALAGAQTSPQAQMAVQDSHTSVFLTTGLPLLPPLHSAQTAQLLLYHLSMTYLFTSFCCAPGHSQHEILKKLK